MGPLIPLCWTSGDVSSGFQRQSGQPYSHWYTCVVVLSGYIPTGPTILLKLQHVVAMAATFTCLRFLNQSQPDPMDHANGNPQGHHLH